MKHNADIVLLGSTLSSDRVVSEHNGDPVSFPAGVVVVRTSTDGLSVDHGDGVPMGVSLGRSLTDKNKVSVLRAGNQVPVRVTDDFASLVVGDLTFTAKEAGPDGNNITITLADELSDGSADVSVDGNNILIEIEAGVTTADAIASAIEGDEDADALVGVEVAMGQGSETQAAAAIDNLEDGGAPWLVIGGKISVADDTGMAVPPDHADAEELNGIILSQRKTGLDPITKETFGVVLVDFSGGV